MIAAVMLYALAVGLLVGAIGMMADRAAALTRLPRRWIWSVVLVASIALPLSTPWRTVRDATATAPTLGGASLTESPRAAAGAYRWTTLSGRVRATVRAVVTSSQQFDTMLAAVWIAGSMLVALVYGAGRLAIARRRRHWREAVVSGVAVLIAPDTGPAVVGLRSPRVVLPEWALDLDGPSMNLVLRHECAHVRAGDPWLIHLAGAVLWLMPWNPVTWWIAARLRLAVELDCDARVVGSSQHATPGQEAVAYGELLLAVVARQPQTNLPVAPALVEASSIVARRIAALFPATVRFAGLRAAAAASGCLALAAIVGLVPLPPRVSDVAVANVAAAPAVDAGISSLSRTSSPPLAPPLDRNPVAIAAPPTSSPDSTRDISTSRAPGPEPQRGPLEPVNSVFIEPTPPLFAASRGNVTLPAAPMRPMPAPPTPDRAAPAYATTTPGLIAPQPIRVERPRYTSEAMRERLSGRVVVEAAVGADGVVTAARVIESLDDGLDQAALAAARQWLFRPATLDGKPVPVVVPVELTFQIH